MLIIGRLQYYLERLRDDPLGFLVYIAYFAVVMIISLVLHEFGHAYVAYRCGDPTAKMLGRMSLDPRNHLDPIGTVCMVIFGIGWAKPVPVNPRNFKGSLRWDDFKVSIAGIAINTALFLVSSLLSVLLIRLIWSGDFLKAYRESFDTLNGLANVYASDSGFAASIAYGYSYPQLLEMAEMPWLLYVQRFFLMMAQMNLALAIFNFLPIPPLDGFHIFNDLLFGGRFQLTSDLFKWLHIGLIVLMLTGLLSEVLSAANRAVFTGVTNLWLLIAGL